MAHNLSANAVIGNLFLLWKDPHIKYPHAADHTFLTEAGQLLIYPNLFSNYGHFFASVFKDQNFLLHVSLYADK